MGRTRIRTAWLAAALGCSAGLAPAGQGDLLLLVRDAPAHGVVVGRVVLPEALLAARPKAASRLAGEATVGGKPADVQWLPPLDASGRAWLCVLKVPAAGSHRVAVALTWQPAGPAASGAVRAAGPTASFTHEPGKSGGLPRRVDLGGGGGGKAAKAFESFVWNDRVYEPKAGSFLLRHDKAARVELLSAGPICRVVRTRARYVKPAGEAPASRPRAVYDWVYLADLPLVLVRAKVRQETPSPWRELHFLELRWPDESFPQWAGGEPLASGTFSATKKSTSFATWALVRDGRHALAVLRSGRAMVYDGRGGYGTYLHAHATRAWQGWKDTQREVSAWLWAGSADEPVAAVRRAADALPTDATLIATLPALRGEIVSARKQAGREKDAARRRRRLHELALAEKMEARGDFQAAGDWLASKAPPGWAALTAGDLAVGVQAGGGGIHCRSLFDLGSATELAAAAPAPLLTVTLRHVKTGRLLGLASDAGWGEATARAEAGKLTLRWARPANAEAAGLTVTATAAADATHSRVSWTVRVVNPREDWGLWRVTFPRVSLGAFAPDLRVFVPQAAGVVKRDVWRKPPRFRGTYPAGWTAMQYTAAYDPAGRTGLYVALHDPAAHTKDISVEAHPQRRQLALAFDHPAANMGAAGGEFVLSGRAVWQVLRGNWFDASMIYRRWVRREASWWPDLTADGRADTPRWMRELCVWGLLGGGGRGAAAGARRFVDAMGQPCGFHWYSWHVIPFDNDYPHYFPAKAGFREAVAEIQTKCAHPAYVMPYINGRLWDTRDKGKEDFEFTKLARAAATKDVTGEVHAETYGSKESDGSRVRLAAMCPSTPLWQRRVQDIVLRLMTDCGVSAVYIDQVAAAKPRLCFDRAHGHPLGGGGWWPAAYGKLLADLRRRMPAGRVLTTECNAEPYIRWFDGYLTWHWQYDGQVPAFPAVYGGAIQMFGRAYRGGPTRELALRMKAGEQLVFGEQIGWIGADVAGRKAEADFLRDVAALRRRLVRYFHAGQMARPPRLAGEMPTVTADWQWHGVWPVTTDAVLAGAWELPAERRLALIFVNVSRRPVTAELRFDAAVYGLAARQLTAATVTPGAREPAKALPAKLTRKITFEPGKAFAWEIAPSTPQRRGKTTNTKPEIRRKPETRSSKRGRSQERRTAQAGTPVGDRLGGSAIRAGLPS